MISIITTDIELLEVFYAHTISPIAIAALTSLIMVCLLYTSTAEEQETKACEKIHSDGEKGVSLTCEKGTYLQMDGRAVFQFALSRVPEVIREAVSYTHLPHIYAHVFGTTSNPTFGFDSSHLTNNSRVPALRKGRK